MPLQKSMHWIPINGKNFPPAVKNVRSENRNAVINDKLLLWIDGRVHEGEYRKEFKTKPGVFMAKFNCMVGKPTHYCEIVEPV